MKWIADIAGWGWSCPIVWGDRVFVTSVISEEENVTPSKGLYLGQGVREPAKGLHHWMVHCFDLNTGKELWKEKQAIDPNMPNRGFSFVKILALVAEGEELPGR